MNGAFERLAGPSAERAHTLFFVETAALWGGPQKRLFRLARAWSARGHATAVAALRGDEHSPPEELACFGVAVFAPRAGGKELLKSFRPRSARAARALVARLAPRLVFTMETLVDYHVRLGLLGSALPVVTLLGIDRWKWEEKLHRRLAMRVLARGPGAVVANSARVLAGWGRVVGEARLEARPHCVIPNPVDADEFEARFERDARGPLVVGGLGRFQPQKGFDVLIDAFARLPAELGGRALVLRLQGHGPDEARLRAQVAALGLERRVEFLAFSPRVQPFLHALDVLVVPSRWAGFENVALEGVLCGTPTLCSTGAGLELLQAHACFAPFEPEPAALARALGELLERTSGARADLAREQRALVIHELDAARIAARFEAFLLDRGLLERG